MKECDVQRIRRRVQMPNVNEDATESACSFRKVRVEGKEGKELVTTSSRH
jgi:hypothetical protein